MDATEASHFRILQPTDPDRHPVPWRAAERRGTEHVIVDAEDVYVGTAPNIVLAGIIVDAVNAYAGGLGIDFGG